MTETEWMDQAVRDKEKLRALVASFHPAVLNRVRTDFPITAPMTQIACDIVSEQIRADQKVDPLVEFDEGIRDRDMMKVYRVLDATWFGVPESTSCWRLEGYPETVALLEDPPAEPGEED